MGRLENRRVLAALRCAARCVELCGDVCLLSEDLRAFHLQLLEPVSELLVGLLLRLQQYVGELVR